MDVFTNLNIKKLSAVFIVFLLIVSFFFLFNFINGNVPRRLPTSPDEGQAFFFSKLFVEKGMFIWQSELNSKYGAPYFRPRSLNHLGDNKFRAAYPLGYLLLLSAFYKLNLLIFFSSLIGIFGVFAVYLLTSELFSRKEAIIASLLTATFPMYLFLSNTYFNNLTPAVLYLYSFYFFLKAVRAPNTVPDACPHRGQGRQEAKNLLFFFSGIFAALTVTMRTPYVLWLAPFFALVAVYLVKKKCRGKEVAIFGLGFLIPSFALLVLNFHFYGNMFATEASKSAAKIPLTSYSALSSYFFSFQTYVLDYAYLIAVFGILGFFQLMKSAKREDKWIYLSLGALCLMLFIFYGFRTGVWGGEEIIFSSSMARYFFLIYIFLIIFSAVFIVGFLRKKFPFYVPVIFLILMVIFSLNFAFKLTPSMRDILYDANHSYQLNEFARKTDEKSVFVTKFFDKAVFPTRNVLIYYTEKDGIGKGVFYPIEQVDLEKDMIPLILKLKSDGFKVYLLPDAKDLLFELKKNGLKVRIFDLEDTKVTELIGY